MNWNGIWYGRNLMRFQVEVSLYPGTGRHQTKVKFILPPSNCKVFPPYTWISEWWNKVWCRENNSAFLPCISLCTNINGTQLTIWLQCDLKIPENEKKYFPKCSLWIRKILRRQTQKGSSLFLLSLGISVKTGNSSGRYFPLLVNQTASKP